MDGDWTNVVSVTFKEINWISSLPVVVRFCHH